MRKIKYINPLGGRNTVRGISAIHSTKSLMKVRAWTITNSKVSVKTGKPILATPWIQRMLI